MLQKLRDQTQSTGFKVLVIAIIVVLTLFGFGATNLFVGADPEVAEVGDVEITTSLLAAETERERRRLLAQMGPDFDPSTIDRLQLQEYVLQQLISRQTLYQTSADLGVRVSPERVNEELVNAPAYQIDGQFNEAVYRQQLQALGYSPVEFVEEFAAALSAEQLRSGVTDSAVMPDWELAELVRVIAQRRDLAYLPLTVEQFRRKVTVSDDEVALRYNEEQSAYMTDLAVDASYIRLNAQQLIQDPSIEISEDDLRGLYEQERSTALADEQRDSSHILIQVNDDRSAEQALELITEVQTRLAQGETFEDLAKEISEDPGSAPSGGALGAVGQGIFDPAFEKELWALEQAGDISSPVLSSFGYHLIRLNDIVVPEYPDFETQRGQLELKARQLQAEELFVDRALELERAAFEERFALEQTAQSLGLEVQTLNGVTLNSPGEDVVVSNPSVLDVLFSEDVLAGSNSEPVELDESDMVIVRVNQQYEPEPIPLEEVAAQIRSDIEREKALAEIDNARNSGLARLQAGESVTEIAQSLDSQWQSFELATRAGGDASLPAEVRQAAFNLPRPTAGEKSVGVVALADGAALITVTRVVQGDLDTTTDTELAELRRIAENRAARFDFQGFFEAAQDQLGVSTPAG